MGTHHLLSLPPKTSDPIPTVSTPNVVPELAQVVLSDVGCFDEELEIDACYCLGVVLLPEFGTIVENGVLDDEVEHVGEERLRRGAAACSSAKPHQRKGSVVYNGNKSVRTKTPYKVAEGSVEQLAFSSEW
jgi:hypothetical protein